MVAELPYVKLYAFLVAPFIGSFVGVLIQRLPTGKPVMLDRSRCDTCHHALAAQDMVPIASYMALQGRCRFCNAPIGRFHSVIEITALCVVAAAACLAPDPATLWCSSILGWFLLALGWVDWRHMILPDALTLPLVLLGFATTYWLYPDAILDHAGAAALGYLALRGLSLLYRRLRGRDGLGEGDAKLMAVAGAWVGLLSLPYVMAGGALITLSAALLRAKYTGKALTATTRLPLGTGLCLAIWLVWLGATAAPPLTR